MAWSTRHVLNLSARSHMPAFTRTRTLCCSWPRAGIGARLDHAQPEVVHPCAQQSAPPTLQHVLLCHYRQVTTTVSAAAAYLVRGQ